MGIFKKIVAVTGAVVGAGVAAATIAKKKKNKKSADVEDVEFECPKCKGKLIQQGGNEFREWEYYKCKKCGKEYVLCLNCGAPINTQKGFNSKKNVWKCTVCEMETAPEKFCNNDGEILRCENCNAILAEQSGFSNKCKKWKCKSCGIIGNVSVD